MGSENYLHKLSTKLVSFLANEYLCDTVLIANDGEIKAHSILLAATSSLFQSAIESNTASELEYGYVINLPEFDSQSVQIMLNFIYTGTLILPLKYTKLEDDFFELISTFNKLGLDTSQLDGCKITFTKEKEISAKNTEEISNPDSSVKVSDDKLGNDDGSKNNGSPESNDIGNEAVQSGEVRQAPIPIMVVDSENIRDAKRSLPTKKRRRMSRVNEICRSDMVTEIKSEEGRGTNEIETNDLLEYEGETDEQRDTDDMDDVGESSSCSGRVAGVKVETYDGTGIKKEDALFRASDDKSIRTKKSTKINKSVKSKTFIRTGNSVRTEYSVPEIGNGIENSMGFEYTVETEYAVGNDPVTKFTCNYCGKVFKSRKNVVQHTRLHNGRKYTCEFCGKIFNANTGLTVHRRIHTGEKPYSCKVCGRTFSNGNNMQRHLKTHTGERTYSYLCQFCGKAYSQKVSLLDHMAKHTVEKRFKCTTCDEKFITSKQLTSHNHVFHKENAASLLCDFCGKGFDDYHSWKRHGACHTEVKRLTCTECEKTFGTKQTLDKHMMIHTGEEPYICSICDKKFKTRQQIRWHEYQHTGEKPLACKICGNRFVYSSSLTVHMRNHTGEKPYKCIHCDLSFRQKPHLKCHMRTHTGEKPFACTLCIKTYKNRLDLRMHSLRVHNLNIRKR